MLSRTADNLFWIARYIERAETMARLLEVGARIALMPSAGHGYRSEWESLLQASGTSEGFAAFGKGDYAAAAAAWERALAIRDRELPESSWDRAALTANLGAALMQDGHPERNQRRQLGDRRPPGSCRGEGADVHLIDDLADLLFV